MSLPILNNDAKDDGTKLLQLSTEINMDGFTGLGALLEAQAKTLQSIEKVLSRQYQSYLDAERERRENEREARNKIPPTAPNTDTPPSAGDDAGGFSLLGALAGGLASLFASIKKSIGSVITKLKSVFKPFESVITKLKSTFKPVISAFESVITKLKSVFKPIISAFKSVFTVLKSVFKPIISSFETVFTVFKNILKFFARFNLFGLIIFGIIDFITGFIDKFKAADSLGEGILEGLWGGFTNIIRGFVAIPLDLLKDLLSWIAEKLGFSEVAKLLDSFSFVDLFNKATEWYYNTETNTWFGGVFDNLPEKMKALYTDLKTKLKSFVKDYIYDGSGDKIKLFGQELPNMTDIANFGTEMKTKLESFIKDYIYDGSGDKIKLFGQELPNMTDIANFGTEIKTKLTEFVKNNIYDGSGDRIKVFGQELPNMTDIINFGTEIKTKLESFIKDYIYDGSGDRIKVFGQELPNMTDISNFGTEMKTKLTEFIKDYIYDPETGSILGINFGDLFDIIPSMDDIKKKLTGLIPDLLGGGGDDSVDLSASTLDPGADKVDLKKMKTELESGNKTGVMKYLSDTKSGDGIENEEEVMKILKSYGIDSIPQAAEGGITPKQPGLSKIGSLMNIHPQEAIIPLEKTGQFLLDSMPYIQEAVNGVLTRNGDAIYAGSNEVNNNMSKPTIIAPTNISDNSVKNTTTVSGGGGGGPSNVRSPDDSIRDFVNRPF
jgi:hypothetical protein